MDSLTLETEAMRSDLYLALGLSGSGKGVPEFRRVLSLLSLVLEKAVQKSERSLDIMEIKEGNTIFHGLRVPSLSIQMYTERIFKYSKYFNNAYYARVGGISTAEMNGLELNLLFSLDFRVSVNVGTFGMYCLQSEKEGFSYHTGYQIKRPIQICRQKERTNVEEKHQMALQTYSCGAVWGGGTSVNVHIFSVVDKKTFM